MIKKSIIEKRCPWCGNIIKNEITFEVNLNRFSAKCKKCSQWYVQKNTWRILTSLILFSYLIYIYENSFNLLWEYILIIPIAIIDIFITRKTSVVKYQNGAWYKPLPPDFKKVNVKIKWFSKEKGGLYLTNIRIWNDYIIPICFIDDKDIPISQVWCIKITEIKRKGHIANAKINFILEQAPESLLIPNNRFCIFNKNIKIGEGIVTDNE